LRAIDEVGSSSSGGGGGGGSGGGSGGGGDGVSRVENPFRASRRSNAPILAGILMK